MWWQRSLWRWKWLFIWFEELLVFWERLWDWSRKTRLILLWCDFWKSLIRLWFLWLFCVVNRAIEVDITIFFDFNDILSCVVKEITFKIFEMTIHTMIIFSCCNRDCEIMSTRNVYNFYSFEFFNTHGVIAIIRLRLT